MCLADLGTVFEELIQDRFLLVILDAHTFALDCTIKLMFALLAFVVVSG